MLTEEKRILNSIIHHLDREHAMAQIDDDFEDAKGMTMDEVKCDSVLSDKIRSSGESIEFGVMCECLKLIRRLHPQARVRVLDWLCNRVRELNHVEEK